MSFEAEFKRFVKDQMKGASGRRLEMLQKDMTAEQKMFKEVLWPAFKTFKGFVMQYEIVTFTGVTIYVDVFYEALSIAFESEGFVAHAENITRDRFDFERFRIRTMANKGYLYYPFSWDELNKKPDKCKTSLFELLGQRSGGEQEELSLYEKTVLSYAAFVNRPIRLSDVRACLGKGEDLSRSVLRGLQVKNRMKPFREGKLRNHAYVVVEDKGSNWWRNHNNNLG